MNVLQRRVWINLFLIPLLIFGQGCDSRKRVVEIINAVEVGSSDYVYSDESFFQVDGVGRYSLRQKAVYGADGAIKTLALYKSEGIVVIDKDELVKDKGLLDYFGFPFSQDLVCVGDQLLENKTHIEGVKKIDNSLLKLEKGKQTVFYRLE